jgi:hypothetical protein
MTIKLERIDGKFVLVLTDELVSDLDWTHGDICDASIEAGTLRIVRTETTHDRAMKIAREVMDEYHDLFATLAKT